MLPVGFLKVQDHLNVPFREAYVQPSPPQMPRVLNILLDLFHARQDDTCLFAVVLSSQ